MTLLIFIIVWRLWLSPMPMASLSAWPMPSLKASVMAVPRVSAQKARARNLPKVCGR